MGRRAGRDTRHRRGDEVRVHLAEVGAQAPRRGAYPAVLMDHHVEDDRPVLRLEVAGLPAVETACRAGSRTRRGSSPRAGAELAVSAFRHGIERSAQRRGEDGGRLGEERVLVGEVPIQRGGGDAHRVGDVLESDRVIAAVAERLGRGVDDEAPTVGGPAAPRVAGAGPGAIWSDVPGRAVMAPQPRRMRRSRRAFRRRRRKAQHVGMCDRTKLTKILVIYIALW